MPYSDTTIDARAVALGRRDQLAAQPVDLPQIGGDPRVVGVGAVFLQAIVEMRQVAQRKRRPTALSHMPCRPGDPARGIEVGARPPELEQGKRAEKAVELVVQLGRLGIVVGDLAAVGGVHRPRRGADVRCPVHVVPPEHVGAGERRIAPPARLPQLLPGHQAVGLLPQRHLGEVAKVPAIGHDAMVARQAAGQQRRLHRAGDRRQHGGERPHGAACRERGEVGRIPADQPGREPDDQQHQRFTHRSTRFPQPPIAGAVAARGQGCAAWTRAPCRRGIARATCLGNVPAGRPGRVGSYSRAPSSAGRLGSRMR